MKRIWTILLCVVLSFSMSACAENNLGQMYIEEAQLTEEEKNIAELLGLNQEYRLYDFSIDDTVKSMRINTYELVDGEWCIVAGGGGQAFEDSEGRLALGFDMWKYLADIDEEYNEMMDRLVRQMAKNEGVTEQLKSDHWVCMTAYGLCRK